MGAKEQGTLKEEGFLNGKGGTLARSDNGKPREHYLNLPSLQQEKDYGVEGGQTLSRLRARGQREA